ncbi:hypothetical protein QGP82_21460 [Leptothoe sp. LEGE 181152]|nr:hypothetical protein [Leptothoe sp. LEGE 181152]
MIASSIAKKLPDAEVDREFVVLERLDFQFLADILHSQVLCTDIKSEGLIQREFDLSKSL